MKKDPVCGMTINEKNGGFTSFHKGTDYYFCSEKCKADFDNDPEAAFAMEAAREDVAAEERARSFQKVMDEIADGMRNPLTSIGGFTRRIYERLPEGDANKEYARIIIGDVERLEHMIRHLIELKTMGASYMEPSDVNDIINDVVKIFDKELGEKNIKTELDLTDKPPDIDLDRNRMKIAVANLIRNAIEAMEKTPGLLRIATRIGDKHIEIAVSDSGKGIPPDKIEHIFDPLFTSKIYGPGLGLTVVQKIIQEHKGTISVESEPGKGATFTIRLPLRAKEGEKGIFGASMGATE